MNSMKKKRQKRLTDRNRDLVQGTCSMSDKQKILMLDFLSEHPSMVLDRSVGGVRNKLTRDELWESLAMILNNCETGGQKDGCGWRKSWLDLKRYESLKAKDTMSKNTTEKSKDPSTLELSPLQERIANLLSLSMSNVIECVDPDTPHEIPKKLIQPCDEVQDSTKPKICSNNTFGGHETSETGMNIAQALQNIASALTERNALEEKKLRVFENLLTVYAAKNGIAITDAVNLDKDL